MLRKTKHPLSIIFCFGLFFIQVLFYKQPIYVANLFLFSIVLAVLIEPEQFKKNIGFYLLMGAAVVLINPLINRMGTSVLLEFRGHKITLESLCYGLFSGSALITVLLLFVSLNKILPPERLAVYFFRSAPKMSLILTMALRFIPLLQKQILEVKQTLICRGLFVGEKNLIERFKENILLLKIVLFCGLEDSIYLAASMECRGYGRGKRSVYNTYKYGIADLYLFIISLIQLFLLVLAIKNGFTNYQYYPKMGSLFFTKVQLYHYVILAISFLVLIMGEVRCKVWTYINCKM